MTSVESATYNHNNFFKTKTIYTTSNKSDLSGLDITLEYKSHDRPYLIMAGSPYFYHSGGVSYLRVKYRYNVGTATYTGQLAEVVSNQNANFVSVVAKLPIPAVVQPTIYIELATDSGNNKGLQAYNSAYLTVVEL